MPISPELEPTYRAAVKGRFDAVASEIFPGTRVHLHPDENEDRLELRVGWTFNVTSSISIDSLVASHDDLNMVDFAVRDATERMKAGIEVHGLRAAAKLLTQQADRIDLMRRP